MTNSEKENSEDIFVFICKEIKRLVPDAKSLSAETDLTMDVAIDSLSTMDLVFALEEEYDLSIPLNTLAEIRTIESFVDLVKKLQSEREKSV